MRPQIRPLRILSCPVKQSTKENMLYFASLTAKKISLCLARFLRQCVYTTYLFCLKSHKLSVRG